MQPSRTQPLTTMCPSQDFIMRDDFEVVSRPASNNNNEFDPQYRYEDYATEFMEFTDSAPTIYHSVQYFRNKLEENGFHFLNEKENWSDCFSSHQKFYTVRNGTSVLAFVVGDKWKPTNGAGIIGTHIDSLTVVVKPTSEKPVVDGYELIGVAPYAGGLSDLWWDRDLGIGGRLVVKGNKQIYTKLVRIPHPIARIASLAPHFGAPSQPPFNPETQKVPFIGLAVNGKLPEPTKEELKSPMVGKHSLRLLRALAKEAQINVADILEVDLHLFDTQPSSFGGLEKEFLFAPRVDDKACTFTAMSSLIETSDELVKTDNLSIVACFDHEEVGSMSRTGAWGNLLESTVSRLLEHANGKEEEFYANSFFLSADVTHAANPNFQNVELENHVAFLNVGITLARDPNGNMITDGLSTAFVMELARETGNVVQQFQIRNDSRSGGTIGPTLSSKTGLRGVDLGIAQLSMHSIRATIGSKDTWLAIRFFKSFFKAWKSVDDKFK